jgi:hypothetical protein
MGAFLPHGGLADVTLESVDILGGGAPIRVSHTRAASVCVSSSIALDRAREQFVTLEILPSSRPRDGSADSMGKDPCPFA